MNTIARKSDELTTIARQLAADRREDARRAADIEATINKAARAHERDFLRAMELQIQRQSLPAFRNWP